MVDFSTDYMGLTLRNPIVVSSSSLTSTVEKVQACERAGAGAVVLKSLFEEQILADTNQLIGAIDDTVHPEARDLFNVSGKNYYMNEYLKLVREAKQRVSIPVIASVNCVSAGTWLEYASNFQDVGADAIELNVFVMPADISRSGPEIEQIYLDIAHSIKQRIAIPVAMKIGSHFSGIAHMVQQLCGEGVDALVLFNRFYRPDVDIENNKIVAADMLSTPQEMALSLQWIALLSGELKCDFSASTGIHDATGVIKQLLVGAKTVQLCSVLFRNKMDYLQKILTELQEWMQRHDHGSVRDFRGMLAQENIARPELYERSQYIRALVGIS